MHRKMTILAKLLAPTAAPVHVLLIGIKRIKRKLCDHVCSDIVEEVMLASPPQSGRINEFRVA